MQNQSQGSGRKPTPVHCKLELYAASEGNTADLKRVMTHCQPLFEAFATCFGLRLDLYIKVKGRYIVTFTDVDWTDTEIQYYRFQAVYVGNEMYRDQATRILRAADDFRKYHGLHWHEKNIESMTEIKNIDLPPDYERFIK